MPAENREGELHPAPRHGAHEAELVVDVLAHQPRCSPRGVGMQEALAGDPAPIFATLAREWIESGPEGEQTIFELQGYMARLPVARTPRPVSVTLTPRRGFPAVQYADHPAGRP